MMALLQLSILGVYMAAYASDLEVIRKLSFLFIIIGMLGSTIAYEKLKERIEKLERQNSKANDIIENNNAKFVNVRR